MNTWLCHHCISVSHNEQTSEACKVLVIFVTGFFALYHQCVVWYETLCRYRRKGFVKSLSLLLHALTLEKQPCPISFSRNPMITARCIYYAGGTLSFPLASHSSQILLLKMSWKAGWSRKGRLTGYSMLHISKFVSDPSYKHTYHEEKQYLWWSYSLGCFVWQRQNLIQ